MNITRASPNPFRPDPSVRLSHFVETSTSNFIFGLIVTWLVHCRHSCLRDLFSTGGAPKPAVPVSPLHAAKVKTWQIVSNPTCMI